MAPGRLFFSAALAIAASLHGHARAAVILNGSFETGALAPWFQDQGSGTQDWTITSAAAQSGTASASVYGNAELKQTFAPVQASTITGLSLWLKHPVAGVTTDAFNFYYSDGTTVQNYLSTTDTAFDLFDLTNRLNPAKSLVAIGVWGTTLGLTYLDSVTLVTATPLPEPPSALFLCAPIAGIVLIRARHGSAGEAGARPLA